VNRRIAVFVLGALIALVLVASGAVYWFLSGDGVRRALEQQASAWLGHPVHIRAAAATLFPRPGITLSDITVGEPVTMTLTSVRVSTDLRALIARRIEDAEVVVSDSRIRMPLPAIRTATASAGDTTGRQMRLVSVRSIALNDVHITNRGREVLVNADSALDGSRLLLRRFEAGTGVTRFDAEGIVELAPRVDATVKITADTLDVDELLELADAFVPEVSSGGRQSGSPPRIAARVSAERAIAGGVEVRQFAADMEVDGHRVSLSPLTFQIFGGRYQGSLTAQLGRTMEATLQSRFLDLDVGQLAAFAGIPGAMTGTLTGAGTFSGRGGGFGDVLRTARGDGTASAANGSIRRLNLIRTVVLFFGRPAPDADAGADTFERIDLAFTLANGTFRATALALHSADADIVGSGTLDVESKALDGQVDLALSEALSAQAGTDLRRYTREGNRIVLPASVGGSLGAPRLRIDAGAALQRGLRNEVQRRLGGLLDQLGR
jgi:uncharacterized protein involved in outer membrane biogenesis